MTETDLADYLYLAVIAGGPLALGLAIAYGILRRRRSRRSPEYRPTRRRMG